MNISNLCDDLIKAGEGSKGGNVIGHTQSGKPIYDSAGSANHKEFTAQDHYDAANRHGWHASRKSEEFYRQGNGDGTISAKGIAKQKKLRKEIEKHSDYKERHRAKAEKLEGKPSSSGPDQRDFDRMDRKNDKDRRSRAWGRSLDISNICDDLIKAI